LSYDAISPVDGRYRDEIEDLSRYFSEKSFFKARLDVELRYLKLLMDAGVAPKRKITRIRVSVKDIKRIEGKLGHDVKALEIYIRDYLKREGLGELSPYVHLGLTSEDVNSVAFAVILEKAKHEIIIPEYSSLALDLAKIAKREADTVMLGRTHGMPAIPTTFGKEISFFAYRIAERVKMLLNSRAVGKFSGAVGTYASFRLISDIEWRDLLKKFCNSLGIEVSPVSKQTVPWEGNSDILHYIININKIMESLCIDLWLYSMLGLVSFDNEDRVGSSTMPHKINPTDIENAEGQTRISNSLLLLACYGPEKTRLQRDLSDSPVRRIIGQGIAHSIIASRRIRKALSLLSVKREAMAKELKDHPEILSEAAQIRMRLSGIEKGYEKVRKSVIEGTFRGHEIFPAEHYLGYAPDIARDISNSVISELSSLKDPGKVRNTFS
jgi:adenylosuccinate lyase